jgi:hypothetical protein
VISSVEMSSRSLGFLVGSLYPRQVFTGQLAFDEFGIFSEKKDATRESDFVRTFFDGAFEE